MRALYLLILLLPHFSQASEILGNLQVDELLLKPVFVLEEPKKGGFELVESSFSFFWEKDNKVSAYMKVGSSDLINQASTFNSTYTGEFTFVEAYAQITGYLGRLRVGMIPIEYGIEGSTSETDIIFNRSLLYTRKVLSLRDLGLSYKVGDNGFYTSLTGHNGESDTNTDGRMYLTSSWGWTDYRRINVGVSGQTGTTKPTSTDTSTSTLAGVDSSKEAKWRIGNFYTHWTPNDWDFLLEANFGELEQEEVITKYNSLRVDLGFHFNKQWSIYTRYDEFDPNESLTNDLKKQISVALVLRDQNNTSNVYFIATKGVEESDSVETADDQIRLVWRLTPLYRGK